MAIALGDAVITITGDLRSWNRAIGSAEMALGSLAGQARIAGLALTAAGSAMVAGLTIATLKAGSFEQAITTAAAVTGRIGNEFEETREKLSVLAKELGLTTVFSAREAAGAFVNLGRKGIDVAALSIEDLVPLLNVASGQQSDLTFATDTVTGVMKQFGLEMSDTSRIADVLTIASIGSSSTLEKLGVQFPIVGKLASVAGIELEELGVILGVLNDSQIIASTGATGLRRVMSSILNPTSSFDEVLQKLNLTYEDVDFSTRGLTAVFRTLSEAGFGAEEAFKAFGQRGALVAITLVDDIDKVDILADKMENKLGSAAQLAKQQLDTFEGALKLLQSALEGIILPLGEAVIPLFRATADVITPILQGIGKWLELHPGWAKAIVITTGLIGGLLIVLGSLLLMASFVLVPLAALTVILGGGAAVGVGAGIAGAAAAAGTAVTAAGVSIGAFAIGPLVLLAAATTGVVVSIGLMLKKFAEIDRKIDEGKSRREGLRENNIQLAKAYNSMGAEIDIAAFSIAELKIQEMLLTGELRKLSTGIEDVTEKEMTWTDEALAGADVRVKSREEETRDATRQWFAQTEALNNELARREFLILQGDIQRRQIEEEFGIAFAQEFEKRLAVAGESLEGIGTFEDAAFQTRQVLLDQGANAVADFWFLNRQAAFENLDLTEKEWTETIQTLTAEAQNFAFVLRDLASIPLPNVGFGGSLGAFQHGTPSAPGGLALVGERGPELVNLPRGARVFTAERTKQMGVGGSINIENMVKIDTVNASDPRDVDDLIVKIGRGVEDSFARRGQLVHAGGG